MTYTECCPKCGVDLIGDKIPYNIVEHYIRKVKENSGQG